MVLLAWPLVFWAGWFFGLLVSVLALFCSFFFLSPCGSSLYTSGSLALFAQYTTFIDQKKKKSC